MKLYRTIIEEEPFKGDHWQTDIYAGSSSSYSGSDASSDWNSNPENIESENPSKDVHQPTNPTLHPIQSLSVVESAEDRELRLNTYRETLKEMKKIEYWSNSAKLQPDRTIDELIAVREVLSALQGLGGNLIFCKSIVNSQEIHLIENPPRLTYQSQSTSISVYQSYIPLLSSLQRLRKMSQSFKDDRDIGRSRTQEAFIASLIGLLQRFDSLIVSIELRILNLPISQIQSTPEESQIGTVISLSRLYSDLDSLGWVELVSSIASCVSEIEISDSNQPRHPGLQSQQLLNSLYDTASYFDAHSNYPITVEESKRVFLDTLEPIWQWVGSWILHGRLPGQPLMNSIESTQYFKAYEIDQLLNSPERYVKNEDSNEFFIKQIELETPYNSDHWWDLNHQIQNHIPKVLIEFVNEILEGGKAKALSNILQSNQTTEIVLDLWPPLMNLLSDFETKENAVEPMRVEKGDLLKSCLFHPCIKSSPIKSSGSSTFRIGQKPPIRSMRRLDFKLELANKLGTQISQHNQLNHQYLHTKFISPSKIKSYITGLNEFFLHGCLSSEIFIKSIFNDFDHQLNSSINLNYVNFKSWYDNQVINQNLFKSLEGFDQTLFLKRCLPKVKMIKPLNKDELSDPIKSLNSIFIELSIPIPLNYILNEDYILKNYNSIFILLSQFSRSFKLLNQSILIKPNDLLFDFSNGKSFKDQIESKEFYKLKHRLIWFLNLWMDYYSNLIIVKFKKKLIEIFDLDELIELNQKVKVMRDCMKRFMRFMFISDECKSIHRIILQLLNLCNRCKEVWKSFNLQANSHIFLNKIDERNTNLERKLRKENRRKKRIELEQYSLIDEEIDSIKTREEEEREEVLSDDQSSIPFSLNLTSFVLKNSQEEEEEEESVLDKFKRMNLEFERLICLLKREIGSLSKRSSRKENLKEEIHVENEEGSKGLNLEEGIEEEEDGLECLMLLECKLNEWIP
ncbi:hypothetical protein DFH28DRAFT_897407 [Melampsora americana]|nr:hypothetical protein DFH28DRAFT_897407 [Melampsora americana]